MASIRIVLDPEQVGLGIEYEGKIIHLTDDAEIVVTGLPDGMTSNDGSKKPSMMLGFKLPNGDLVVAETSWRLFASAYQAFLGKFGEPDMAGMRIEIPSEDRALEFVKSDKPFIACGHCGWKITGENTKESVEHLVREYTRHYKKKHPKLVVPPPPEFPWLN